MLDLPKLFNAQNKLDSFIIKNKHLENEDLRSRLVLAFQIEFAELINEWQMFKFWKNDPKPNTTCPTCKGDGCDRHNNLKYPDIPCPTCDGKPDTINPFLEEYVDGIHFLLSIGNNLELNDIEINYDFMQGLNTFDTTIQIIASINQDASKLLFDITGHMPPNHLKKQYQQLFSRYIGLGVLIFHFSYKDITDAYFKKNKENYERQKNNY